MRREVSFLMAEGHPQARHYPLCMLWREADIARARWQQQAATNAILIQNAIGSVLSEKGSEHFQKLVTGLADDGEEG